MQSKTLAVKTWNIIKQLSGSSKYRSENGYSFYLANDGWLRWNGERHEWRRHGYGYGKRQRDGKRHATAQHSGPKIRSSSEILFATNLKMPEHRLNMQPTRVSALISIWRTPLSHRAPLRENLISKKCIFGTWANVDETRTSPYRTYMKNYLPDQNNG